MVAGIRDRAAEALNTHVTFTRPERPAMKEQLLGTTLPVLSISLESGESVVAETGEFSWMTDSIQMSTGACVGGRSTYTAKDAAGVIAFASKLPGNILGAGVSPQNEYLVHRHGFLAGTPGIEISAGFQQSFSAGIFAGEGFVLQRVGGQGRAWIGLAAMRAHALHTLAASAAGREAAGPGAARAGTAPSVLKVLWSRWHQELGELAMEVLGAPSMVARGAPYDLDDWQRLFLFSRADTIYGGSDEIQRTLIAERALGLPRQARA